MRKHFAAAAIAALAVTALAIPGASGERVRVGNMVLTIDGSFSPKKLPRQRFAPIALRLRGQIRTVDGSHAPPVRQILLEFDRNGTIFSAGLPVCRPGRLESKPTQPALRACRSALVGRGQTRAEVAFPEQTPFTATGPLLIFNGPRQGGQPSIVMHVYAAVPAPTAFVVRGIVSNAKQRRFGKRVLIRVPTIAGGSGSLTDFNARIQRTWRHRGKQRSYLIARCRGGRLLARGDFRFGDGTRLARDLARACRPR